MKITGRKWKEQREQRNTLGEILGERGRQQRCEFLRECHCNALQENESQITRSICEDARGFTNGPYMRR